MIKKGFGTIEVLLLITMLLPIGVVFAQEYEMKDKIISFFYEKRYPNEVHVANVSRDGKSLDIVVNMPNISYEKYRMDDGNIKLAGPKEVESYRQIKVSLNQTLGKSRVIPGMNLKLVLLGYNEERHLSLCNDKDECYGIEKNMEIVREVDQIEDRIIPTFVDKRLNTENIYVYQD